MVALTRVGYCAIPRVDALLAASFRYIPADGNDSLRELKTEALPCPTRQPNIRNRTAAIE
jgi:hypothetical protein